MRQPCVGDLILNLPPCLTRTCFLLSALGCHGGEGNAIQDPTAQPTSKSEHPYPQGSTKPPHHSGTSASLCALQKQRSRGCRAEPPYPRPNGLSRAVAGPRTLKGLALLLDRGGRLNHDGGPTCWAFTVVLLNLRHHRKSSLPE